VGDCAACEDPAARAAAADVAAAAAVLRLRSVSSNFSLCSLVEATSVPERTEDARLTGRLEEPDVAPVCPGMALPSRRKGLLGDSVVEGATKDAPLRPPPLLPPCSRAEEAADALEVVFSLGASFLHSKVASSFANLLARFKRESDTE
jgi:hypothetical protein